MKNPIKNIISLALTGFLLAIPIAMAASFNDIENSTHKNSIQFLKARGVVQGYSDGTYRPTQSVNRAEFVKILVEAKFKGEASTQNQSQCFSDVRTEWFAPYVCYAKSKAILTGYADGTFKPSQSINLAEALKVILKTYDIEIDQNVGTQWYEPYTAVAEENDWLSKIDRAVSHDVTRGEMAELVYAVVLEWEKRLGIAFAEKFATCTPYEYTFIHILTKEDMKREILGMVNGKCKTTEEMPNGGMMNCEFDNDLRVAVAQYYEDLAEASSYGISIHIDSEEETVTATYTIDGKEVENPMQEALDTGACTVSGYEL